MAMEEIRYKYHCNICLLSVRQVMAHWFAAVKIWKRSTRGLFG